MNLTSVIDLSFEIAVSRVGRRLSRSIGRLGKCAHSNASLVVALFVCWLAAAGLDATVAQEFTQPPQVFRYQQNTAATTDEHRLFRRLMQFYEPSIRPVVDFHSALDIHFRVKLIQILELSEKDQTLVTNLWIEQQWYDEHLKWDLQEFKGIHSLRMPSPKVWLPDTYIYNVASSQDGTYGTINAPYVMLRHDGLVKYPVPMKLKSNCEVDITYFPFDQQVCYIKFASWLYDLSAINFTTMSNDGRSKPDDTFKTKRGQFKNNYPENIDLTSFIDNSGWILLNVSFLRRERNHTSGLYPELIYFIHIKRRYMYYVFNVILPCAMLSVLTCMTFWLPCVSGEKVTLGLTCFVAYSVFMLMVAEKVPATSEIVPILSIYLTVVMSFTSLSILMAVFVTNIHEKTKTCRSKTHRVPRFIRHLCINHLSKYLGMQKNAKQLFKMMVKRFEKSPKEQAASPTTCNPNAQHSFETDADNRASRKADEFHKKSLEFLKRQKTRDLYCPCEIDAAPIDPMIHICTSQQHTSAEPPVRKRCDSNADSSSTDLSRINETSCSSDPNCVNVFNYRRRNDRHSQWMSPHRIAMEEKFVSTARRSVSPVWVLKNRVVEPNGRVIETTEKRTYNEDRLSVKEKRYRKKAHKKSARSVHLNELIESFRTSESASDSEEANPLSGHYLAKSNWSVRSYSGRRGEEVHQTVSKTKFYQVNEERGSHCVPKSPARKSGRGGGDEDDDDDDGDDDFDKVFRSFKDKNRQLLKEKAKNSKWRIRKEYMSIYLSYEWVLVGLVLDRIFFWIYTILTLLSYILTLYVIPFRIQSEKADYTDNVP